MQVLIDPYSDGHIHTALCRHAVGNMEDYVIAAINKGLHEIVFLEHMEEGILSERRTWLTEEDFDHYFAEGTRLKALYSQSITIGIGVEVGFNPFEIDTLIARITQRKWDRVGISLHFLSLTHSQPHLNLVSKSEPRLALLSPTEAGNIERSYYRYLAQAVEILPGDIVCHIDGVLRFYPQRHIVEQPWDLIDALLEKIAQKKMAIELNTSGIAIRNEIFPCKRILRKAMAKNIDLSAGSDAHKPESVGHWFNKLNTYLEGL